MSDKSFYEDEATGIYIGTLQEDMIETVAKTKKLCCDVLIEGVYSEGYSYPLTYVPLWAMSLPLRKGDKVMVKFNQDDFLYPVLYKNADELDSQFYEKFDFDSIGIPDMGSSAETVGATRLGEDSYIIKTDNYTVWHQNNGFILMDNEDNVFIHGKNITLHSDNGKFNLSNKNGKSLFTILQGVLTILNTSLSTQGSPGSHVVVPNQFQNQINDLMELMQ